MLKLAILDDYLDCALKLADWDLLRDRVKITVFTDPLPPEQLAERLADFDILCLMRDRTPFPGNLIRALPKLKFISYTGGVNLTLDAAAAAATGIVLSTSLTANSREQHFEFIWALLLATMRNIPRNDAGMRQGLWQTGYSKALFGRTIGIVGLGNFGARVADMAPRFGMQVVAWSQNLTAEKAAAHGARLAPSLEAMLAQADVVTIHLKMSDRVRGLFGPAQFAAMKPGTILINTSRGPIIQEPALIEALASGRLERAGLDVYDLEPLPADHPLRSLPNVVLSPHMGFCTEENMRGYYEQTVGTVEAWLNGAPINVVDADLVAGRKPLRL